MAEKIVVASGKGGVGKSSFSVGLAKALAARGKNVLIVDFDKLRSIDLLLGAGETIVYDWGDFMLGRCTVQQAIYKVENVSVMTCPKDYRAASINGVKTLMSLLEGEYDYIILDSPAGIELGFILACCAANRGIIVSLPNPVCVRSACAAAEEMKKYKIFDVRLVINRMNKREMLKNRILGVDSVIDAVEVQLIGIVPEDKNILTVAMGSEIYSSANSSYKAFNNIAARLEGENRKLGKF